MEEYEKGILDSIPLYMKIYGDLRKMIVEGKLLPRETIPSEIRLKKQYGVSRYTVQQAIRILASEGLVKKRQGLGTFVKETITGVSSSSKPIVLHLGGINQAETPLTQGHLLFARLLEEQTRGQIRVHVHHSSELGTGTEQIKKVQNNQLDMFGAAVDWLAQLEPDWGLMNMGFLFRDFQHLEAFVTSPINGRLKSQLAKSCGLRVISDNWLRPSRVLISRTPCFELRDLQEARMRIPSIPIYRKVWEVLGTRPVEIPWASTKQSFSMKKIDAADAPLDAILGMGFPGVAPFITLTGHLYSRACIVIADRRLNSFRPDIRAAILRAADQAGELYSSGIQKSNGEYKSRLLREGARFIETDLELFRKRVGSLATRMERQGSWTKGLFSKIQNL